MNKPRVFIDSQGNKHHISKDAILIELGKAQPLLGLLIEAYKKEKFMNHTHTNKRPDTDPIDRCEKCGRGYNDRENKLEHLCPRCKEEEAAQKKYEKQEKKLCLAYSRLQQARSQIYDGQFSAAYPVDWKKLADDIDDLLDVVIELEEKEKPKKEQK